MKRILTGIVMVLALATGAQAAGPYLGASGNVAFINNNAIQGANGSSLQTKYDTGAGFNLAGGYSFDGLRFEGEFSYMNADLNTASQTRNGGGGAAGDLEIRSYSVNGYYDFVTKYAVTPFVGAGLGVLHGEVRDGGNSLRDTALGYQVIAGATLKLTGFFDFDLAYRYKGAATDLKDGSRTPFHSSNIVAGIRYNF